MILLSLKNLLRNKSRSFLTSLGVVIGVAAIVSLVSVSYGVRTEASSTLGGMQYYTLMESGAMDGTLSVVKSDLMDEVSKVKGVKSYAPGISFYATSFNGEEIDETSFTSEGLIQVRGIDPGKSEEFKNSISWYDVSQGRMIKPGEDDAMLVNEELAEEEDLFIGSVVEMDGESFEVVGFFKAGSSISQLSDFAIVTIDKARDLTNYEEDETGYVNVLPSDLTKVSTFTTRLENIFPNMKLFSSEQATEMIGGFLDTLTTALWIVSGIAAIVGGIGVMNTMLMSVMERITEFGVLKAVGWRHEHIIFMIVGEAVLITLTGGLIGAGLGYLGSYLVEAYSSIPTSVPWSLIVEVLLFSAGIGVVGSIYPAFVAKSMSPVEAVTYE